MGAAPERIDSATWIVVGAFFAFAVVRVVIPAIVRGEDVALAVTALAGMVAVPLAISWARAAGSRRRLR